MLRIFLTLALLAAVQCEIGPGLFGLGAPYYYEGESESSESSSETSSETSSESSSETSTTCPCAPLDVGQCCDDCRYCKDENAVCDTYGFDKLCVCKQNFIFDYGVKKCVPENEASTTETTQSTTTPTTTTVTTTPPCTGSNWLNEACCYTGTEDDDCSDRDEKTECDVDSRTCVCKPGRVPINGICCPECGPMKTCCLDDIGCGGFPKGECWW